MYINVVVVNAILYNIGYSIVEIENEEIPLSSAPKDNYYFSAICGMVLVVVLLALLAYFLLCERYRRRIRELDEQRIGNADWKLWKLVATVKELEMQKTDDLIGEIKKTIV